MAVEKTGNPIGHGHRHVEFRAAHDLAKPVASAHFNALAVHFYERCFLFGDAWDLSLLDHTGDDPSRHPDADAGSAIPSKYATDLSLANLGFVIERRHSCKQTHFLLAL